VEVIDCLVQTVIGIDKRVGRPELFLELVARYYFAWVCQQEQEDLERPVPEFDPQTLLAQFARMEVRISRQAPLTNLLTQVVTGVRSPCIIVQMLVWLGRKAVE
jgi:hypothetical protein